MMFCIPTMRHGWTPLRGKQDPVGYRIFIDDENQLSQISIFLL